MYDAKEGSHRGGESFLPNFLADLRATAILAGGMGTGAVRIFHRRNVDQSIESLRLAEGIPMMRTETRFPVRYAETDQMGIVHHSNYAVWFEAGRTDFLNRAGASNASIEARGVLLPVYGMNCWFKSPARYEDEILVVTSLKQVSRVRLCFSYRVLNAADRKLLATGETMHAWTDRALKPINAEKAVPDVYSGLSREVQPEEGET